jgi:CDP-diglyceride synthetase
MPTAAPYDAAMLARIGINLLTTLIAIAVGILISAASLANFSISVAALIETTLLFWVVHIFVSVIALKTLVREPSIALAGLLALASTIVALIIVNLVVSGLAIHGIQDYLYATLIIWVTTSIGDMVGRRMIRARRQERTA